MKSIPDRVDLDRRRYERQQAEAEMEHRASRAARIFEAHAATRDPAELRKLLEDEGLAGPLAELMQRFERLPLEIAKLEREHRVQPEMLVEIKAVASTLARIERQLFSYAIGDE